jgi:DNA-directed RNA polymerase subunit alpha
MIQIQCLESKKYKSTCLFSRFSLGPLKKGQAITMGNALRRVLLSNIPGFAITGVRIAGINHEFSTVLNLKEDIIELLLNLKQLKFKSNLEGPIISRLVYQGQGIITGNDIDLPEGLELVDPRQYIADLTAKSKLEMEFLIEKGEGYCLSNKKRGTLPPGFLAVDSVFMPVRRANFFTEIYSDNVSPDLETLILEIETDGSITPKDALCYSAELLEGLFTSLQPAKTAPLIIADENTESQNSQEEELNNIPIEELELSVRAYNCLKRANVYTLADLLKHSKEDLLEFKNFGQKSANEVFESLESRFGKTLRKS